MEGIKESAVWWETADFYLACFIKARGIKVLSTSAINEKKVVYRFDDSDGKLQDLMKAYYNGDDEIKASRFVMAIKELRGFQHLKQG